MNLLRRFLIFIKYILGIFVLWMMINAVRIWSYSHAYVDDHSDVAIVLGAGTNNGELSPVFKERLNHGISLLKEGKVDALILTGGVGEGQTISDSRVALNYVISQGADKEKIYIEETSEITHSNLVNAKEIMKRCRFDSALIVSDPLHMKRSLSMCKKLDINAQPSPTQTSMYRSLKTKLSSLLYESFFFNLGVLQGYNCL